MANKRVFIAFAIEDKWARDYLVGQARNDNSPFEFVDMSVKEPFKDSWKIQCRQRIKGCDGAIILISRNTRNADGQLWEIGCIKDEGIPRRGVYTTTDNRPTSLPTVLNGVRIVNWTWENLKNFISTL